MRNGKTYNQYLLNRSSAAYRQAFAQYLRYGTPIRIEAKADDHPSTHYIWRTQGDNRVRPSHRANEGKIFAWSDPPSTGHPGEDFGCRCWAEPYFPDAGEYFEIRMLNVSDQSAKWSWLDFVKHYFGGHGDAVTVRETGHLNAIVSEYERLTIENPRKLPGQIADEARKTEGGVFRYTFGKPYQMQDVVFSIGNTTIGGTLTGHSRIVGQMLELEGHVEFYLIDAFADPLDIREFGYAQIEKIYNLFRKAQEAGIEGVRRIANYVTARMGGAATTCGS